MLECFGAKASQIIQVAMRTRADRPPRRPSILSGAEAAGARKLEDGVPARCGNGHIGHNYIGRNYIGHDCIVRP